MCLFFSGERVCRIFKEVLTLHTAGIMGSLSIFWTTEMCQPLHWHRSYRIASGAVLVFKALIHPQAGPTQRGQYQPLVVETAISVAIWEYMGRCLLVGKATRGGDMLAWPWRINSLWCSKWKSCKGYSNYPKRSPNWAKARTKTTKCAHTPLGYAKKPACPQFLLSFLMTSDLVLVILHIFHKTWDVTDYGKGVSWHINKLGWSKILLSVRAT